MRLSWRGEMDKKYAEIPSNFDDIKQYTIQGKTEVVKEILSSEKCFFYDTCSIQHHSNSQNRSYIIEYLKSKKATIILTRTVLMELSPNSFNIHPIQIQYFKELYDSNIKIIILNEEYVYDCLKEVFNYNNKELNLLLGHAVNEISKHKGKTYKILNEMERSLAIKIKGFNPGNAQLFTTFFKEARAQKEEADSLAEELIFICIIMLTSIPYLSDNVKYIFFSNDLLSRSKVIPLVDYIYKYYGKREPYQLTTAAMVYKMYRENILIDKEKLLEIMRCTYGSNNVSIYYVGEYDLKQINEKFSSEKIVDRIMSDKEFKLMY